MSDLIKSKKVPTMTLKYFIDENHKLLSSIGIFIAITVFSMNLDADYFSIGLSFLFLLLTVLLWIELLRQFPQKGSNLLSWFEVFLGITLLVLIFYWIIEYYQVWFIFLPFIFQMIVISVSVYPVKKFNLFNIIFKTSKDKKGYLRFFFYLIIMLLSSFLANWISTLISPSLKEAFIRFFETTHK